MKQYKKTYGTFSILAAAVMVITLVWLTVSTPFIYAAEQQQETYSQANNTTDDELPESDDAPLGNNTEEKTETKCNTLSEYLHHIDELSQPATSLPRPDSSHDADVYVAFHGETLCPPPNSY